MWWRLQNSDKFAIAEIPQQPPSPDGSDDNLGFILQVLRAYQGQSTAQEVVARMPGDDPRLETAEICLMSTGVVSGEFGFVGLMDERHTLAI